MLWGGLGSLSDRGCTKLQPICPGRLNCQVMRHSLPGIRAALFICAAAFAFACDIIQDINEPYDGPVCYSDSDCVPNDCCGRGTRAVHFSDAPSCQGISCSGS